LGTPMPGLGRLASHAYACRFAPLTPRVEPPRELS